jgi:hypothetical protein|nr:MAG TPA: hypothetical protein [Caudoviricetes sp.]
MRTKAECDNCGWVHGTPGENRAFRWCRRIRGTVCDQCCEKCEYNDESIHSGEVVLTKE